MPLLFRAKRAVIIGDPNQLRHITSLKDKDVEEIAKRHGIENNLIDFHYNKNSAYHTAQRKFTELTKESPFILRNHYRCHKDIIQFSNINFYKSELFPKSFIKKNVSPIKHGVYWKDVKGNYNNRSNPNEAFAIINFLKNIKNQGLNDEIKIGIITPFRNQKFLITNMLFRNKMIRGRDTDRILASTVHSFQGDERDIIIYSPVMSSGIAKKTLSWLDRSTDLLNVAITRAKSALIIFGDTQFCIKTTGLHKQLLNYCTEIQRRQASPTFESTTEEFFYQELIRSGIYFEYQVPIGRYRVDFLLKMNDKYLCIEIDGGQHLQNKSYDYSRDEFLKGIGYEVIRMPNNYVERNCQEIINSLKQTCVCQA
jgi:superfamily I DNA and/or RNA helicase